MKNNELIECIRSSKVIRIDADIAGWGTHPTARWN